MRIYKDNLNNGIGAESMTNMTKTEDILLDVKYSARSIYEAANVGYWKNEDAHSGYQCERILQEMDKMMDSLLRLKAEAKHLKIQEEMRA